MNLTTTGRNESTISSHLSTSELMFGNYSTINVTDVFQNESLLTTKAAQPPRSVLDIMMGYVLFQVAVTMNMKYPVVLFAVGVPGNVAALINTLQYAAFYIVLCLHGDVGCH
ncbi:hypothetical protein KUTeg_015312 [Tegillarca granosa]|uniref:Uncharacterized protein n=1 Tax=Tegillarca granosa TaxID=220873 RepID=A0ABQ9EV98_TEGGR|nr:hypothetical protein KUTeg_015312 [Tegillarca granosa]